MKTKQKIGWILFGILILSISVGISALLGNSNYEIIVVHAFIIAFIALVLLALYLVELL